MESKQPSPYTAEDASASSTKQDDNYDLYQRYRGTEFSPEEEARVLRKIDIRLVPVLFLIYLIQYLDKNSLNFASVYGLKTATKLEGQDYSWLGAYSSCVSIWCQYRAHACLIKGLYSILDISLASIRLDWHCRNCLLGDF